MKNVMVEISRFVIIFLMTVYVLLGFTALRKKNKKKQKRLYRLQRILIFGNQFICNFMLYLNVGNHKVMLFYLAQAGFLVAYFILYPLLYPKISRAILNHMMMLFSIGFVMLARLSYDSAWRQFGMAFVAMGGSLVVPVVIRKMKILMKLQFIYLLSGVGLLAYVYLYGVVVYGAKNWISVGGVLIQPSEFVKILFVFFAAASLSKVKSFLGVVMVSGAAAVHVMILVLEKDLGASLILFITYVIMLYIATGKSFYLFGGLGAGSVASVFAYQLFPHVKVRVSAWLNPWGTIENSGYQVAQSLFAIGTGGWFGMGIGKGLPTSIPVGKSDFIFAAISEEFGGIFALWLMLLYITCFVLFITIALRCKEIFYKLAALGLSIMFIVQVLLCIGGVTKFIPSTGVTLPLVSYGGSSVFATVIVFSILQGIYIMNQSEEGKIERRKRKNKGIRQKENIPAVRDVEE
ncbi:FtsW/RodA/SpoVE family cell cycle protein [[Clostridium] polysaccharolyticum]|uniref:Cell division protein FtsW, lipid II flippase n=1 Tax=[Clostridium] polysaccharolyticum TaxID=29364 RepID=A0A1I0B316_9FIRM|nr:FtsW/RodA/SpoVE family cell cycle protein [[Clostridium] polysaccharolyticum]SET01144.1 cell division protein FtsW, lipid II flippase [[Clostridium] polysaccharolyticum]